MMELTKKQMRKGIRALRKKFFRPRARKPRWVMYPQYLIFNDDGVTTENFQTAPYLSRGMEGVIQFDNAQDILDTIAYWQSETRTR